MSAITFITDVTVNGPVHYPVVFDLETDAVHMLNIYGDVLLVFGPCCEVFLDKEEKNLIGRISRNGDIFKYTPVDVNLEGFQLKESELKDTHQGNKHIDFEVALSGHFLGTGQYNLAISPETLKTRKSP